MDLTARREWCGAAFTGRSDKRFFSKPCYIKARTAENKAELESRKAGRICEHCGNGIPKTKRGHAIFCSRTCNSRAQSKRRRGRRRRATASG